MVEFIEGDPPGYTGSATQYDSDVLELGKRPGVWGIIARKSSRGSTHQLKLRLRRRYGDDGYEFRINTDGNSSILYGRKLADGANGEVGS